MNRETRKRVFYAFYTLLAERGLVSTQKRSGFWDYMGDYFLLEHETGDGWFVEKRHRDERGDKTIGMIVEGLSTPKMLGWIQGAGSALGQQKAPAPIGVPYFLHPEIPGAQIDPHHRVCPKCGDVVPHDGGQGPGRHWTQKHEGKIDLG